MGSMLLLVMMAVAAYGQVAEGGKIFRSHCAECHGVTGEGGRGPSLQTGVYFHGGRDEDLFRNISDGIEGTAMPGVFFSPTQVWHIVAYVKSLSKTAEARPQRGEAGRGAALMRNKQCLSCHLVRGEGGVRGPDLTFIGSQRSLRHLREALVDPDAKVLPGHYEAKVRMRDGGQFAGQIMNQDTHTVQMLDLTRGLRSLSRERIASVEMDTKSAMPSYKGQLSEGELDDLVAYMWSLQRQQEKTQ